MERPLALPVGDRPHEDAAGADLQGSLWRLLGTNVEDMRHDARAGLQFANQLRPQPLVDALEQIERYHGRLADVRGEEVLVDEPDAVGHTRRAGSVSGDVDELRIDLDADAARAVLRRRSD